MEYQKRHRKRERTIGEMVSSLKDEAGSTLRLFRRKAKDKKQKDK